MSKFQNFGRSARVGLAFIFFVALFGGPSEAKWKYQRLGNSDDSSVKPSGGFALMGGGSKLDEAYKFLCQRANGGDFLVLSADDDDAYLKTKNAEIMAVCPLNSAATLAFFDR